MEEFKFWVSLIFWIVLVIAILFGLIIWMSVGICNAQTLNIGFPHTYNIMGGCLVQPNPGQWIPLENWRFFGD
jgi:hypothetical protein